MRLSAGPYHRLAAVAIPVWLACLFAAQAWTGFTVERNDFWGLVEVAGLDGVDLPSRLYSGFYPAGSLLLLTIIQASRVDPVVPATVLSLAALGLLLLAVWRLAREVLPTSWALGALGATAFAPLLIRYATVPGPDLPAAALALVGFAALWPLGGRTRSGTVWAGMALGAAVLLRYHMLAFASCLYVSTILVHRSFRSVVWPTVAMLLVCLPQVLVSLTSGHGLWETSQAFNIYKLVHPVDWTRTAEVVVPASAAAVITDSPLEFLRAWWTIAQRDLYLLGGPAALVALAATRARRTGGVWAGLTMAGYLAVVAAGGSSRGALPVIPIAILTAVLALHDGIAKAAAQQGRQAGPTGRLLTGAVLVVAAVVALSDARAMWGLFHQRQARHAVFTRVETLLREDGVTHARAVYSSDLDVYLPHTTGHVPRRNGTWLRVGETPYRQRLPDFCVVSIPCLAGDARRAGVTHLILVPDPGDTSTGADEPFLAVLARVGGAEEFGVYRIR